MHFFNESFWIAISFIIFVYLTYKPIRRVILSALDTRINEIKNKLLEAEKLKQDAKILLEEINREMEHFEQHRQQILESAKESTAKMVEIRAAEIDSMLSRKRDSTIKAIEKQKSQAFQELSNEFTDLVGKIVHSYLIESNNNKLTQEEIINNFLKTNKKTKD
ncbi:MAG: ATP F0F1 synthase subunit B [Rickettsiaceae bacterium]|nr:ATP F0F1 synthase subunit B [Rickettsiaceae bacterium]